AVPVRVGVLFRRAAVGGPARVTDAVVAGDRVVVDGIFERRELAGASSQLDISVVHDRHAGRVIAAIFEAPQSVDQNRDDLFGADIADDPAHIVSFFSRPPHPPMSRCRPALTASAPAGTFSRIVAPLPTYDPAPIVTGATSCESLPMNAPSSM